jgi:hypothetical protein
MMMVRRFAAGLALLFPLLCAWIISRMKISFRYPYIPPLGGRLYSNDVANERPLLAGRSFALNKIFLFLYLNTVITQDIRKK